MKKLIILTLLTLSATALSYNFKVSGNKRTKSKYIIAVAKRCLENNEGKYIKGKLDQCIFNERIFVSAESLKTDNTISIKVEDKWTLIPVPNYSTDGSDRTVGVYLVESNFLGKRKLLVLGASVSTRGNSFFLMHRDPAISQSRYTLLIRAIKASNTLSFMSKHNTLYSTKQDLTTVMMAPGIQFSDKLNVSLGLGYTEKKFSKEMSYLPEPNHYSTQAKLLLEYNDTKYKIFFNEGTMANLHIGHDVTTNEDENKFNFKLKLGYQKVLFGNQIFQLQTNYYRELNAEYHLTEKFGGEKGARGVKERTIWTDRMLNLAFDYQIKVKEFDSGVITIAPFVDLGSYHKLDSRQASEQYVAYGAGAYYYIKKVDLPAMGFQAGINPKNMGRFFGLYIGSGG